MEKAQKQDKPCDLSCLVNYYLRISNHFWEDLLLLQSMIKSKI